jgi:hypothetical protein
MGVYRSSRLSIGYIVSIVLYISQVNILPHQDNVGLADTSVGYLDCIPKEN